MPHTRARLFGSSSPRALSPEYPREARKKSSVARNTVALLAVLIAVPSAKAQAPVRLQEAFPVGYEYRVSSRVELTGTLTLSPEKDKGPQLLTVTGRSAIEYDERVLAQGKDGRVGKTVRLYRRVDFQRK